MHSENERMSQGVRQLRTGFKAYVSLKDQETKIARQSGTVTQ